MLEELFGSKNRERVLQYILANKQAYAKEIADFYQSSVDPIKKQLERLEIGGILVSQNVGRTRIFMFNPRYAFKEELAALLEKARKFYSEEEQERLTKQRKGPRRTGKTKTLTPTDRIKDRLVEYYYWDDEESLEEAVLVACANDFDMKAIETWSQKEGMNEKFSEFKLKLYRSV